jgi:hypothetical protein
MRLHVGVRILAASLPPAVIAFIPAMTPTASSANARAGALRLSPVAPRLAVRPATATRAAAVAAAPVNGGSVHFRTVDIPGASGTAVNGINDQHVLLGTYFDETGAVFGFIKDGSHLTRFNYPSTSGVTESSSINDAGNAVGSYTDAHGIEHGWGRSAAGAFSQIDDPLAGHGPGQGTSPQGINGAGIVVGSYTDGNAVSHGFVDKHGRFTTVDARGAGTSAGEGTVLGGVNDLGVITGDYIGADQVAHGFVDNSGTFFEIDAPQAGTQPGQGTLPAAISDDGVLDGAIINGSGAFDGWLLDNWQFIPVNEPTAGSGADQGTNPLNISANGQLACGVYAGDDNVLHGFVATLPLSPGH